LSNLVIQYAVVYETVHSDLYKEALQCKRKISLWPAI
jgi:hypothetical protein